MNVRGVRLAVALAALLVVPGALAGTGGSWQPVVRGSGGEVTSVGQMGLARIGETLHVGFSRQTGSLAWEVAHRSISGTGRLGTTTRIATGGGTAPGVAFALAGSELLAFFGAEFIGGQPVFGLMLSRSGDGGSWSTPTLVYDRNQAGRPSSATVAAGNPLQTWYAVGETVIHAGLDPASGVTTYCPSAEFCTGTTQNIASNASGETYVVWCTWDAPSQVRGVWVQRVDPATGGPAGDPSRMPRSTTPFEGAETVACQGVSHRTPLVARPGGGFFTAVAAGYPTRTEIRLWRLGAGRPTVVGRGNNVSDLVALAATPEGRLWAAWAIGDTVVVRRSNKAASRFGAPIAVKDPKGQEQGPYVLDLSAQATRLDVFGRFSTVANVVGLYHRQLLAPLALSATGGDVVRFTVTDVGDPVAGATIRVGGRTVRTNAQGKASVDLPPGTFRADVSKAEYAQGSARVRAR